MTIPREASASKKGGCTNNEVKQTDKEEQRDIESNKQEAWDAPTMKSNKQTKFERNVKLTVYEKNHKKKVFTLF